LCFYKAGAFVFLAFLVGCGEQGVPPSQVSSDSSGSVKTFKNNAIVLSDGAVLDIEGRIIRYELVRRDKVVKDRYTVESSLTLMGLESRIYSDLARRGYVRRVRIDSPSRFLVSYRRKGLAPITADYRAIKDSDKLARLILTLSSDN